MLKVIHYSILDINYKSLLSLISMHLINGERLGMVIQV